MTSSAVYRLPAEWKVIWITGASTGIGREVALRLAASGVKVAVSARSAVKLAELETASANITAFPLDVGDLEATKLVAAAIERTLGPVDLAILNAGVWKPMNALNFDAGGIAEAMQVNYFGVVNALEPLLKSMIARRSGHIAMVSSVAGYRGLPVAIAYAPTKAALISLAESLYPDLLDENVKLTVINPGFVQTDMTAINTFPMPFIISCEDAADRMIKGLIKGKFEIVFPLRMKLLSKFTRVLPYGLFFGIINRLPADDAAGPDRETK